jgi:hypothetical protein
MLMMLATSLLSSTPPTALLNLPEDKNLWFERDNDMEWARNDLDPLQRGGRKGKRRCGPPDGRRSDTFQQRRRGWR